MKHKIKLIRSPVKQKILLLVATGVALGLTRSYHKHVWIIKNVPRAWRQIDRDYLWRLVKEFKEDRLINWQENERGIITMTLTKKGTAVVSRFNPDQLSIPAPARWDGKWRVVMYDVPESKKVARDAIRFKLKELGFKEWQKSVFIHPYPGHEQVDFVTELFDLRPYIRQAELTNPTNEAELKIHFQL